MARTVAQAFTDKGFDINTRRASNGTGGISTDQEKFVDEILLRASPGYTNSNKSSDQKMDLARQYSNNEVTDIAPVAFEENPTGVGEGDNDPRTSVTAYRSGLSNASRGGGGASPSSSPAAAWNATQQAPAQSSQWNTAQPDPAVNNLYATLQSRIQQSKNVDAADPVIRGQVDSYRAEQERARRNLLSDSAESGGPRMNMRGTERITAEKVGQNVGAFQAELMGRELQSRRDEIAQALQMGGAMLSGDQNRALQRELAMLDQEIKRGGLSLQRDDLGLRRELGRGALDMQGRGLDLQGELGRGELDVQRRGLDLQGRGLNQSMDQFLRELAQRQYEFDDTSDWRWASTA